MNYYFSHYTVNGLYYTPKNKTLYFDLLLELLLILRRTEIALDLLFQIKNAIIFNVSLSKLHYPCSDFLNKKVKCSCLLQSPQQLLVSCRLSLRI